VKSLLAPTVVSVVAGATLDLSGISQTCLSLSGAGRVTNSGNESVTLTLSNSTGMATFSGSISDSSGTNALSLVQAGGATNILSGLNTYRGTTKIQGGTLLVNGSLGTDSVTITNSGTLGGNGTIAGAIMVQRGGGLAPGSGVGRLTVSNNVALQLGSTTLMEISKSPLTNDQLRVTGTLTCGGTLTVTNIPGALAANDSFQLFNAGLSSGTFAATNLPPLNAGLGWSFSASSGVLSVVQTVATDSTNLSCTLGSGTITLAWPADHIGWRLEVQTNHLAQGVSSDTNDWMSVADSQGTNSLVLPINLLLPAEFYRLVYP
jgi:autotransporter-associated beta strand protein